MYCHLHLCWAREDDTSSMFQSDRWLAFPLYLEEMLSQDYLQQCEWYSSLDMCLLGYLLQKNMAKVHMSIPE